MRFLHASLDRASEGSGGLVLLSGGWGVGKTRMATEFARQAKHRGFAALWARCPVGEGASRFGPWAQILAQCVYGLEDNSLRDLLGDAAPALAAVVPAIGDRSSDRPAPHESESPQISPDVFDDIVRLLGEVARRAPQLVVLDDIQSADPDSLLFLQFLTHHLDGLPLLVVATFCEEDLSSGHPLLDALVELGRAPATQLLDLEGLDASEIGQLVAMGAGVELATRNISTLRQCTDGNPLFVLELLRALGVGGLRDLSENVLRIVPVTPDIRAIVSRRLTTLSAACREGLQAASTIGYLFPAALFAAVVTGQGDDGERRRALSPSAAMESVNTLLEEGVVAKVLRPMCEAPACYRFSDWFTMNVLRQEVPVVRRASLQRRIAQILDRERTAVPCLTEWAFRSAPMDDEAGAATAAGGAICTGRCKEAAFLESLSAPFVSERAAGQVITPATRRSASLRKEGDYWTIQFGTVTDQLKESTGLVYLGHLLRYPRRPFFVMDLVALSSGADRSSPSSNRREPFDIRRVFSSSAEPMMDAKARTACRARLSELREDLAEAQSRNDLGRAARARYEMEQLLCFWEESVGFGGRTRSISSSIMERARSAVTKRIRAEIVRLDAVHPDLGRHLAATIVTGRVCSYQPERNPAIIWDLPAVA
jgi:hypothetical protein